MVDSSEEVYIGKGCVIVSASVGSDAYNGIRSPYGTVGEIKTIAVSDETPWSPWGTNNLLPVEFADDLENCGVLLAAMDAKARIGTGKGMQPFLLKNIDNDGKEDLEWVRDTEIHDWLEQNESFEFGFDSSFDKHAYGWNCGSYLLNLGRTKIEAVIRRDVYEARLSRKNNDNEIEHLYISSDWKDAGAKYDSELQTRLLLLQEGREYKHLNELLEEDDKTLEFAFVNRTLRNGRHYYPMPIYRSGRAWIQIARSVPALLNAMFKNQITIKYLVRIHPKFWEDKFGQQEWNKYTQEKKLTLRQEYHDKIDRWLTGVDASYKSIFTGGFQNPMDGKFIPYLEVEALDDKLKDGKYLPESGAANSEILFALMINPALMGAGNPGGKAYGDTSGGSNVRESFLVQLMIMEAERRLNASVFNVVKKFNGWDKKIQGEDGEKGRLVFRYPSGLLTTLDTGKSTKAENL